MMIHGRKELSERIHGESLHQQVEVNPLVDEDLVWEIGTHEIKDNGFRFISAHYPGECQMIEAAIMDGQL